MRTVFIVLDSLNRHYLGLYGAAAGAGVPAVDTPNIDRLARRSAVFDQHYAGSLPCMPARREMMTGRVNFMETPWGAMQPFDDRLPERLREAGVYSHLITDHYHYFRQAAHGYHTAFTTWEFCRGQEGDPWRAKVRAPEIPEHLGQLWRQNWVNRQFMDSDNDLDYSTPQCFQRGIEFLRENGHEDDWFLQLEVFDPHEPFACPNRYRDRYAEPWKSGYHFDWPPYGPVTDESREAIAHVRACYAGTLTMADTWLGYFLDTIDELDLWGEGLRIILTTDHGHLLGEHGYFAKNYMYDYRELVHIPLVVYDSRCAWQGRRIQQLTTTIDTVPTVLSGHGVPISERVQGIAWDRLLAEEPTDDPHHDAVLYGYWGKTINITDGRYTYTRAPDESKPLYDYTALPIRYAGSDAELLARAESGVFLPYTGGVPVFRIPFEGSKLGPHAPREDLLFDLETDPQQESPIADAALHQEWRTRLAEVMRRYGAPASELERFGLR